MNLSLQNRRALVCGASQGIGRAVAEELAALGARCTVVARNEEKLKELVRALPSVEGGAHDYRVLDFTQPDEVQKGAEELVEKNGNYHILINNTGGPPGGPLLDADVAEFERAMTMHLHCSHRLVQTLVPGMEKDGYGRIINIISTSVKQPIPGLGVSNTTRGAMASWAKTLAGELGPKGITMNNVLPGFTKTSRLDSILTGRAEKAGATLEDVVSNLEKAVPLRRFAQAHEVAAAAAFLASPAGGYITGHSLPVDGGRIASL